MFENNDVQPNELLKDKIAIGKVRDSHGLKGELFVMTTLPKAPPWVTALTEFTLALKAPDDDGKHKEKIESFTVKKIRPHKKGFIVKSEDIEDRNASDLFKGAAVYIEKAYLETEKGDEIYLREIKGFMVFNGAQQVGPIMSFSTNTAQDLLVVDFNGHEIQIPFVKDFVEKIDWDAHTIVLNLPEGLLDNG